VNPGALVRVNMMAKHNKAWTRQWGDETIIREEVYMLIGYFAHPFYGSKMAMLLGPQGMTEIQVDWVKEIQ
jgi:hypothetical protein